MLSCFKLFLLCGLCSMVTSLSFFFTTFDSIYGNDQTLVDFSKVIIDTVRGGNTYGSYLRGPITTKTDLDDSYKINYSIRKIQLELVEDGEPEKTIYEDSQIISLCDFYDNFNEKYLKPIASYHNDFPPKNGDTVCPIPAGTYNIFKVNNIQQLDAPTDLEEGGAYYLDIIFLKDGLNIGGFKGAFVAINETAV